MEPIGVFHGHRFSALAGGSSVLTVEGNRLPIPTGGAISFTAGACGDLSSFKCAARTSQGGSREQHGVQSWHRICSG